MSDHWTSNSYPKSPHSHDSTLPPITWGFYWVNSQHCTKRQGEGIDLLLDTPLSTRSTSENQRNPGIPPIVPKIISHRIPGFNRSQKHAGATLLLCNSTRVCSGISNFLISY